MKKQVISIVVVIVFCGLIMTACGSGDSSSEVKEPEAVSSENKNLSSQIPEGFNVEDDGLVTLTKPASEIEVEVRQDAEYLIDVSYFCTELTLIQEGKKPKFTKDKIRDDITNGYTSGQFQYTPEDAYELEVSVVRGVIFSIEGGFDQYYYY